MTTIKIYEPEENPAFHQLYRYWCHAGPGLNFSQFWNQEIVEPHCEFVEDYYDSDPTTYWTLTFAQPADATYWNLGGATTKTLDKIRRICHTGEPVEN